MISIGEIICRLLLAAFLGSMIGLERERLLWAAGLRTHMLVCVGSCLMMITSAFGFFDILGESHVILDPSRIAAQVVSGIGFLGAGAILLRGNIVHGLTTAASIWSVSGIGLAVGGGLYIPAVSTTVIILIILAGIKPLEESFRSKNYNYTFQVKARRGKLTLDVLQHAIDGRAGQIKQFIVQPDESLDCDKIHIILTKVHRRNALKILEALQEIPCVIEVKRKEGISAM
ncbi:MAG: MgtC/SapB family protein [Legionellaceae bacterium]|nr:MgtC/SapB family protein [Legionellaceae bacterium]